MITHDYYEILHVHPQAAREIIKASYRTLMQKLKYHPDLGGDEAEAALINKAYAVLYNPCEREKYDQACARTTKQPQKSKPAPTASYTVEPATPHKVQCAFCQHTQNSRSKNLYMCNELCSQCGCPISTHEKQQDSTHQRDSIRVDRHSEMSLVLKRQPHKQYRVNMENMSAIGLSIVSNLALIPGDTVKLSNSDMTAVAEVVHCKKRMHQYQCGLKFLSIKRNQAVGNFITASA